MSQDISDETSSSGLALAGVQFFLTLGWTLYVIYLPELLKANGIAANWLPWLLMADQIIFAVMDIAFGAFADRISNAFRKLAVLILSLSTVSAGAFLLLPMLAGSGPTLILLVLAIWVVAASVVRAPTLVLLSKQATAAQQGRLVIWYSAGIALASAVSPFFGLWLKGVDPRLPFALGALTLLVAVVALLYISGKQPAPRQDDSLQPIPFTAYLPLLAALGLAVFGFQIHAFINSAPLFLAQTAKENLPWLMPALWIGFFAALVGIGTLVKRFGAVAIAAAGIALTALASLAASLAGSLEFLVIAQVLAGVGWAAAFAGMMEQASLSGVRGAEGVFMGSFFAVTALCSFARIGFASQILPQNPALQALQHWLPAAFLLAACLLVACCLRKAPLPN